MVLLIVLQTACIIKVVKILNHILWIQLEDGPTNNQLFRQSVNFPLKLKSVKLPPALPKTRSSIPDSDMDLPNHHHVQKCPR